jgi:hypothetical protein
MRELSESESTGTLRTSRKIGKAIGSLHGSLLLDREIKIQGHHIKSEGERIMGLFSRSAMTMEDVGDLLGRLSGYFEALKKGMYRNLGEMDSLPRPTGRKQKVVRRSGRERRGPLSGMSLLREVFMHKQDRIRERFSGLRRFKGSPMIPAGLDTGLDRIGIIGDDFPVFKKFDWSFFDIEGDEPQKTIPLKDLALVLNSLMKARYLSARRCFQNSPLESMEKQLSLMYMDYNLAKDSYLSMMADIPTISLSERKEVPFRYVLITSILSSLWYEKNRNALIIGYNEGLTNSDAEDLLIYPRGVDTIEGIRLLQVLTSLSSVSRTFEGLSGGSSVVGLESDLLTALSV